MPAGENPALRGGGVSRMRMVRRGSSISHGRRGARPTAPQSNAQTHAPGHALAGGAGLACAFGFLVLGTAPALGTFAFDSVEGIQMASTWIRMHVGGGAFGLRARVRLGLDRVGVGLRAHVVRTVARDGVPRVRVRAEARVRVRARAGVGA